MSIGVPVEGLPVDPGAVLEVLLPNAGTDDGPGDGVPVGVVALPVGTVTTLLGVPDVGRALESVMGNTELDSAVGAEIGGIALLLP